MRCCTPATDITDVLRTWIQYMVHLRLKDSAIKRPGSETILAKGNVITGVNTSFTQTFRDGDKLRFRGKSKQFKVNCSL